MQRHEPGSASADGEQMLAAAKADGEQMQAAAKADGELVKVLIADDHALFRQGVKTILSRVPWIQVLNDVPDGAAAIAACAQAPAPDVILMDVHMPVCDGLTATAEIRLLHPRIQVLILTASDTEATLFDAIKAGALGYILKTADPELVIDSVLKVHRGEPVVPGNLALRILSEFSGAGARASIPHGDELTPREVEVLRHLSTGASNRDIAQALFISENTVRNHVRSILEKLHVNNRAQAALYAQRQGYVKKDRE